MFDAFRMTILSSDALEKMMKHYLYGKLVSEKRYSEEAPWKALFRGSTGLEAIIIGSSIGLIFNCLICNRHEIFLRFRAKLLANVMMILRERNCTTKGNQDNLW